MRDPFLREGPIVQSLADDDFYKLSMLALIDAYDDMRSANVTFAFKNRTAQVELGHHIAEEDIRYELDEARKLRFNETELRYIGGHFASKTTERGEETSRMFTQRFIDSLRDFTLPEYDLIRSDGHFILEVTGDWFSTTLWEIHVLQIIAQLYFEHCIKDHSVFERQCIWGFAQRELLRKVNRLRQHPGVTFVDFGTRRRACLAWQRYVNEVMLNELPNQYRGTSNVMLSMEQHTVPMGTFAHELIMGMSGIMHGNNDDIRSSHNTTFDRWWEHFGQPLSVALSDTYGTEFFRDTFGAERAANWKGTRQDSGDPFVYGEKLISFYEYHSINPREKLIVFSDGLDVDTIIELHERFAGRINVTFGWGTNLTNDFGSQFHPLSLVMKLMKCNGHRTVKLSDNLGKTMGTDEDVERFKHIFGYKESFNETPRY